MRGRAVALFVERAAGDAKQRAHGKQQPERRQHIDGRLGHDDQRSARHAQAQPCPAPGVDPFMRDHGRQQADQNGLQRRNQRKAGSGHA
ncbi:hypothetical protein D3C81_2115660 [compost metagenome]